VVRAGLARADAVVLESRYRKPVMRAKFFFWFFFPKPLAEEG
jgi:hypothetical protein